MRTEFEGDFIRPGLFEELKAVLPPDAQLQFPPSRKKLLILVSREPFCLGDILIQAGFGGLPVDIQGVISNHPMLEEYVKKHNLPFVYMPHEGLSREEHEARLNEACAKFSFDYMVLAKYMRILSPQFVNDYSNRIVNIHHSFLPAFVGARPYMQAYDRGVKIIGATAHYVTHDLDEGPIICQDVVNIDHTMNPHELVRAGRDVEKTVLSRALRLVVEDRVFVLGRKTVIL